MGLFSSLVGGIVGFFVGGPVGAVIGAGIGATKIGEKVVNTVLDFVTQPFMPAIPSADAASEAERQQGVMIQTQGSTVNVPIVYGYRKVAGAVVFAETGSTDNKYLYVAYVFSEGLVEGLREVYIDDWMLPTDMVGSLNGGSLVSINSDKYKDRVQLRWYPGAYFANPRNSTVGSTVKGDIFKDAPSFTSNMNFNGLAVLFARYEWKKIVTQADADANPFKGNIPEIQVCMLGKRVASLLVDSTETGSYDSNPVRYSTNPAEILLDYLRNPRYGKGLANADIDWASWKTAAYKCNTTVTYVASGIQGPILTLNTVVDTNQTLMSNTKTMLQNFRGYMPYVQGKYKLRIEDAGNPTDILSGAAVIVQTFTKDDIVSDITYNGIDRSSKYNVVSVTYVDPDQKWSNQQVVYPETEAERQKFIDQDGGRENKYEATLGGLTNYAIAKDMARLIFNKQRYQESCVFTATSRALELEPGDCIRIQSNLLNFGSDPWRVISVKINNDMTVDLGCVRNPDFIYPYVRVGEEDIVLPIYVPKGSIIYYPASQNALPVGLVPPQYAVYPPVVVPSTVNPGATDPLGPTGGGVGGGSGGSGTVNTTNNTANDPPPPPPFDAVLTYKKTVYAKNDASTGLFTVTFTQPSSAVYDYALFWWRPNQYTNWTSIRLDAKPGPGGEITVNVGPLSALGQYDYIIRCYAIDGRASTNITQGYFRAVQSQTVLGELLGTGSGSTIAVTSGWQLPSNLTPQNPWYDDEIQEFEIRPKLTSGHPSSPRRLTLTMTQLLYTFTTPVNPLIDGVYVYYKYKDDTYWTREELLIPSGKSIMEQLSWDLAGDFGTPAYPASALYTSTAYQLYDFVIRLKYKDGTTAKKQIATTKAPVEMNGTGLYDYAILGNKSGSTTANPCKSVDIPSGFDIPLLSQQDPALTYNTGQDIMPNFVTIKANSTASVIYFRFNPPTNSKFRGYRIRYRPVQPGSDPDFITKDVGSIPASDGIIYYDLNTDYSHSTKYEWMITALYRDNSGNTVDAKNCWYARATVPFGVAGSQELLNSYFNFETKDTKTTLGEITDAFPAVATIVPQKWIKHQDVKYVSSDTSFMANSVNTGGQGTLPFNVKRDALSQPRINAWYQLQFQAPNQTFTSLNVYRRVYSATGATRDASSVYRKYYELGPWEKIVIPRTSLTDLGSGLYSVNLRGPLSFYTFNANPTTTTLVRAAFGSSGGYPEYASTGQTKIVGAYPYFGVGNGATNFQVEYLFVLDDSGEGTKAVRLTDFYTDIAGVTAGGFKSDVDGIQSANQPRDDYRLLADYNVYDAGLGRNINEAITGVSVDKLTGDDWYASYPKWTSTTRVWTYLSNPSGITLY